MKNELIKEKYPQGDLFICDVSDAIIKDIIPQLEHPFYSLSKTPIKNAIRYEYGDDWVEILPSYKGMATIYDKDILIYAISQVMAKLNQGENFSRKIRITSRELLMFCNRGTSGRDYMALQDALDRLDGTRIRTSIALPDNEEQWEAFGLINSAATRRKNGIDGRMLWCEIELSEWVINAIKKQHVLTLNRDYFRLRKPIERRIYEIARKHCGQQSKWTISLSKLHTKTGSQGNIRKLRFNIKELLKTNHLPDYTVDFNTETDMVTFGNRSEWWDSEDKPYPKVKKETYAAAELIVPEGTDVYGEEQEWFKFWKSKGRPDLKNPDKAFLGFLNRRYPEED